MEKANIRVDAEACTQCLCCQLICSFSYTGTFNPERAMIKIDPPKEVSFTDECVQSCFLCTRYCPAGAIEHVAAK